MEDFILPLVVLAILAFVCYVVKYEMNKIHQVAPQPLNEYPVYDLTEFDKELIWRINEYRTSLNISSLKADLHLSDVSYSHSIYMAEKKTPSHDFFTTRNLEYPNNLMGEVVAYNYQTPQSMLQAWKESPNHNAVLLSIHYHFIGLSVAFDNEGRKYCCCLLLE